MQKILRKRVLRDLKKNLFRYLALGLMIALSMYMIVSMVGAAETVIQGVDKEGENNHLEDGQFSVFVPLTETTVSKIEKLGADVEPMFYQDYELSDESKIRIFQNREQINKISLDEGALAVNKNEIVLEKRYCAENKLSVGDQITIGATVYSITGIGSVPDYDAPYESLSDSSVDSRKFGVGFVTNQSYEELKRSETSSKSEGYVYAYRLNGKTTDDDVKQVIQDADVAVDEIEDSYFQDYWKETTGQQQDLINGIADLTDGAGTLENSLSLLASNNSNINKGAEGMWNSILSQAQDGLGQLGITQQMNDQNYTQVMNQAIAGSDSALVRMKLKSVLEQLTQMDAYRKGVSEYTDGVSQTADGSADLKDGLDTLKSSTQDGLGGASLNTIDNLTQFIKVADNPRVKASSGDQVINKYAGLVSGVIVMILFTYVISVFVIHGIEQESSVIGALYALGAKTNDLILHYLTLPVVVAGIGGLVGTAIGFSPVGIDVQMQDCIDYYSFPTLPTVYSVYLLIYGIVMPPVVAAVVNCLIIHKKLKRPALSLLRNEQKQSRISNVNLGNMGFVRKFRIRQMLREMRTGFTVIFGMFISLLVLMMGIDCYLACNYISTANKEDTRYEYMYSYKYPDKQVPDGGTAAYAETLKKERFGYNLDVTLLGIEKDNPYFNADVKNQKNSVILSSAAAEKYNLKKGDQLILLDEAGNMDYAFTVDGVTQYSVGLYVFMDINSMRELFHQSDDYYNVVFSDSDLAIDAGRLYAVSSKSDISKASGIFVSKMMPMVIMMIAISVLIFCVVMYLMMKVMIDRSSFHISLIRIFGFRMNEVRKLYLNGNFYMIAVGAAICIPLSKKLMDLMYPLLVANVSTAMRLTGTWQLYLGIYVGIIVLYLVINQILVQRLKKIVPAEVLKNRE